MAEDPVVSARNLRVCFGDVAAVRGVDLVLPRGRAVALVGESGSGKSVTARALIGLTGGVVTADELRIAGHDVAGLGERGSRAERAWRRIRGRVVGTVLQDALGSLDPLRRVGAEVADAARLAGTAVDVPALLESVGLDPAAARRRPDELSGGMRQRALIAAALAADPEVVVADEPTTALDTTRQAVVLDLLRARVDAGGSLLFITHDLGAARRVADDVVILDAGRVVETGPFRTVMADPASTEGRRLVASVPWGRPRGEALLPDAAARLPGDARPGTVATQGNAPAPPTPAVSVGGAPCQVPPPRTARTLHLRNQNAAAWTHRARRAHCSRPVASSCATAVPLSPRCAVPTSRCAPVGPWGSWANPGPGSPRCCGPLPGCCPSSPGTCCCAVNRGQRYPNGDGERADVSWP